MVLVVDLDEQDDDPFEERHSSPALCISALRIKSARPANPTCGEVDGPKATAGIAVALACYPIAIQLAHNLDLTTIHELSRTCRSVRDSLLTLHTSMMAHAMRCENDTQLPSVATMNSPDVATEHIATLPIRVTARPCTRDMVGECRRCNRIVCRNCTAKPPTSTALKQRYRRLCRTCLKCPLSAHTSHTAVWDLASSFASDSGESSHHHDASSMSSTSSSPSTPCPADLRYFQVSRSPCTCDQGVWICQPCGQSLRTHDFQYLRVWTWRERYSTYIGGMGTGIGEGLEGEECGRKKLCLAAQEIEKEIECDISHLAADAIESERASFFGRSWTGTSYTMQEVEGLGGILKKKIRRRERIGRTVKEYEEERRDGKWLQREQTGQNRSWCSWCDRVVPSNKDLPARQDNGHGSDAMSTSLSMANT